eukprot:2370345-Rhodomonas_salina.2
MPKQCYYQQRKRALSAFPAWVLTWSQHRLFVTTSLGIPRDQSRNFCGNDRKYPACALRENGENEMHFRRGKKVYLAVNRHHKAAIGKFRIQA